MRHLFLTSSGFYGDSAMLFMQAVAKYPQDMRVLYIPTAGIETDGAREGIALALYELGRMGVPSGNIFIYNLELLLSEGYARTYSAQVADPHPASRLLTSEELADFDVVLVSGGDATVLCREMVRTGFGKALKSAIEDGLVYVGVSAGSMYAAGNLAEGMHIIPNAIVPHYDGADATVEITDTAPILLADGRLVYVDDAGARII